MGRNKIGKLLLKSLSSTKTVSLRPWPVSYHFRICTNVVLILLSSAREHCLTEEERKRNGWGLSVKFYQGTGESTVYPSSLPGFFPPIYRCTCVMEPFDLPVLGGLHLIPGLCDGVFLGTEALAGFPSLKTLPHTAMLGHHGVNVHGSESRNKSMVVHIQNPFEGEKTEKVAQKYVGERVFIGWPFLQEGKVVAISDSLFKYEKLSVVPGAPAKVIGTPHAYQALGHWKSKAERIESVYSKRGGVLTGEVEVLLHVRPLKGRSFCFRSLIFGFNNLFCFVGLKRLEDGALVKDYEDANKEVEQALQMAVPEVSSEDVRYLEQDPPPLSEEFPENSKIFFLGEHAYGVAAQVSGTTEDTLSVILAVTSHSLPVALLC